MDFYYFVSYVIESYEDRPNNFLTPQSIRNTTVKFSGEELNNIEKEHFVIKMIKKVEMTDNVNGYVNLINYQKIDVPRTGMQKL